MYYVRPAVLHPILLMVKRLLRPQIRAQRAMVALFNPMKSHPLIHDLVNIMIDCILCIAGLQPCSLVALCIAGLQPCV